MISYSPHTNCRVCDSDKLTPYLDLGYMPLSNSLAENKNHALTLERLPLKVLFCENCSLSQLSIVVDPKEMFSHYVYRSSINRGYVQHCHEMARYLKRKYSLTQASSMIDIAGNDCALLKEFKDEIGLKVLNVDPAKNLFKICVDRSIPSLCEFWGYTAADKILDDDGQVDLITATNVFAHVDNVNEFICSCKVLLKPDGVLVLEFPYLIDFIENKEFDTVYFEHLSYFSIHPLDLLCSKYDLEIMHVSKIPIHGGSVRVEIQHKSKLTCRDHTVSQCIRDEKERYSYIERYLNFASDIKKSISSFRTGLRSLTNVAGFAASAKGNTLLNSAGITKEIRYIVDETPEKKDKFSPGTGIRIVSMQWLKKFPPDYLVILSWNFADEIIEKVRSFGYKGKFVIPIPSFKIID